MCRPELDREAVGECSTARLAGKSRGRRAARAGQGSCSPAMCRRCSRFVARTCSHATCRPTRSTLACSLAGGGGMLKTTSFPPSAAAAALHGSLRSAI